MMEIKNQQFPIWHTIQISMLALLVWVLGVMTFMPAFISHSARLVILIILIVILIIVARITPQAGYRAYLITTIASVLLNFSNYGSW